MPAAPKQVKKKKKARGRPKFSGPDVVCCVTGIRGAEYHHIYSQKAYPKLRNEEWNKIPVAHQIHYVIHNQGLVHASTFFHQIQLWLVMHGWYMSPSKGTWMHDLPSNMDLKSCGTVAD